MHFRSVLFDNKHFKNYCFIISEGNDSGSATKSEDSILIIPCQVFRLTLDAYPSIFSNSPYYLWSKPPAKRRDPDMRHRNVDERSEQLLENQATTSYCLCLQEQMTTLAYAKQYFQHERNVRHRISKFFTTVFNSRHRSLTNAWLVFLCLKVNKTDYCE